MGRSGIKRLVLKKEGFELELERDSNGTFKNADQLAEHVEENTFKTDIEKHRSQISLAKTHDNLTVKHGGAVEAKEDTTSAYVTAPMVGTFYVSVAPDSPAMVKVGDRIEKNTIVGIIEAMKVMNEIKAGVSGTVAEILVENSHPVEFGTKLFRIT